MPGNLHAILLIVFFVVPGFVFVEVDARLRPSQKFGAFERTVVSVLFSTIWHGIVLWMLLLGLLVFGCDVAKVFDLKCVAQWSRDHVFFVCTCLLAYLLLSILVPGWCGSKMGLVTRGWMPVVSRVVDQKRFNSVLVQMKNGDFFTGLLDKIPADYDVLQGPAKDFTITPPGRYKPKGQSWQKLEDNEVVLLNTSNVDAIRVIQF